MRKKLIQSACASAICLLAGAAIALSLIGCLAIKEPRPNVVVSEAERSPLRNMVVGIMPPPVFVDTNRFHHDFYYDRAMYDQWGNVKQFYAADNLLHRLQYLDIFKEVNYTNRLNYKPDVVLIPHESWFVGNDPYGAFLFVYSLGFLPLNTYADEGLYFLSVNQPSNNYSLRWPKTELRWWFSPVLNMFPAWSRNSDTNSYKNAMTFYLVHNTTNVFNTVGIKGNDQQNR